MNKNVMPTPYLKLNEVLQKVVTGVREILDLNFVGAYLQGSFAVGDFDEYSDVDFIVVTATALSEMQVAALQLMHGRIYQLRSSWAQHLEGSYFPQQILRDSARCGEALWYLDNGASRLIQSDHCNTIVVRWVVREKGIVLAGPPPTTLVDPISAQMLRQDVMGVIHEWGREILATPDSYNNRFYQGFIVLSYCRMLHDLHTGENGSKWAGAEWAKVHLAPMWSGLIDRAWACRPNPAKQVRQRADPDDFASTLAFVQYVMKESEMVKWH